MISGHPHANRNPGSLDLTQQLEIAVLIRLIFYQRYDNVNNARLMRITLHVRLYRINSAQANVIRTSV